ncbi:TrbG/VirB9 family P-type conjugative transfer protein [Pantoea endophytica]|uniref:TrbG/VirB9 family P-type conjugative transfer protein n=1 Tax=Pantoea sp. BJ2 TaxID=3141322 RepID=A0AAU7U444_9GAMM
MNKIWLGLVPATFLFSTLSHAAGVPQGSAYDSRMQQISYNATNTTVITTAVGYLSTLLFDDSETVIDARPGMEKGWDIKHDANRVYIRAVPIAQPVTDADGKQVNHVFEPTSKEWVTNLFVVTTKRYYSIDLRVLDAGQPANKISFVVTYRYPQEVKAQVDKMELARLKELQQQQEKKRIQKALDNAQAPRNFDFSMFVGKDSQMIKPDFAYDDGRFTYIGFSPIKKLPAAFLYSNGKEVALSPGVKKIGNYTAYVIPQTNPSFVLRYGDSVIGIVNQSFGKVTVTDGTTISEKVERVEVGTNGK